jgi:hypothetical protein
MGDIKAALATCDLSEAPNYSKIATEYRVNRVTLSRHHKGLQGSREEAIDQYHSALSKQQQLELVGYINKLIERRFPPTNTVVRNLAEEITRRPLGKN